MNGPQWKLTLSHTMTNVSKWGPTKPLSCRGIRSECRWSKKDHLPPRRTRCFWVLYGPRLGMWVTTPFSEMAAHMVMLPPSWPGTSSIYLMEAFILLDSSCQLTKLTVWLVIGCVPLFSKVLVAPDNDCNQLIQEIHLTVYTMMFFMVLCAWKILTVEWTIVQVTMYTRKLCQHVLQRTTTWLRSNSQFRPARYIQLVIGLTEGNCT